MVTCYLPIDEELFAVVVSEIVCSTRSQAQLRPTIRVRHCRRLNHRSMLIKPRTCVSRDTAIPYFTLSNNIAAFHAYNRETVRFLDYTGMLLQANTDTSERGIESCRLGLFKQAREKQLIAG